MNADERHRLTNAIVAYGAAKAMWARAEGKMRPIAHKAVTNAWNVLEALLDELEEDDVDRHP